MLRLGGTRSWQVRKRGGIQRLAHIQPIFQIASCYSSQSSQPPGIPILLFLGGERYICVDSTITDEAPQHKVSVGSSCSGTRLTSRLP